MHTHAGMENVMSEQSNIHEGKVMNPAARIFQRYFVPRFGISLYYFFKYRCMVGTQTRVQFSKNISFGKGTVVKPYVVIQTHSGKISIGKKCAISSFVHISNGANTLKIGDYVRIASHVTILGSSRNYKKKEMLIMDQGSKHEGVTIEDDVLIGAHAVILPGCHIGKGAVIGAGSVVRENVLPYKVVAGSPARVIRERV